MCANAAGDVWLLEIDAITPQGRQRLNPPAAPAGGPSIRIGSVEHFSGNMIAGDHNTVSASIHIDRLDGNELAQLRRLIADLHTATTTGDFSTETQNELQPLVRSLEVQLDAPNPPRRPIAATIAIIKELTLGAAGNGVWAGLIYAIEQIVTR